jgi:hypothetical protein
MKETIQETEKSLVHQQRFLVSFTEFQVNLNWLEARLLLQKRLNIDACNQVDSQIQSMTGYDITQVIVCEIFPNFIYLIGFKTKNCLDREENLLLTFPVSASYL